MAGDSPAIKIVDLPHLPSAANVASVFHTDAGSMLRMHEPGCGAEASEPGIFAEVVSISSTRPAGVSDSAYFIQSIELRPTFDLLLGACRGLQFSGCVSSGETLIRVVVLPRRLVYTIRRGPGVRRWSGRPSVIVAEAA